MAIKKDTDKVIEKKNGMNIVDNMDGEERANNKLNSMMVKLTKTQKAALKRKQNIANATGDPIKVEDLVKDKVFIAAGDKKEPATIQEINDYLKKIKKEK